MNAKTVTIHEDPDAAAKALDARHREMQHREQATAKRREAAKEPTSEEQEQRALKAAKPFVLHLVRESADGSSQERCQLIHPVHRPDPEKQQSRVEAMVANGWKVVDPEEVHR